MRASQTPSKAVVNEIGPPLRCLLLSKAPYKLRNARYAPARRGKQHSSISLHNAIGAPLGGPAFSSIGAASKRCVATALANRLFPPGSVPMG
jgi:hypothetical protein